MRRVKHFGGICTMFNLCHRPEIALEKELFGFLIVIVVGCRFRPEMTTTMPVDFATDDGDNEIQPPVKMGVVCWNLKMQFYVRERGVI